MQNNKNKENCDSQTVWEQCRKSSNIIADKLSVETTAQLGGKMIRNNKKKGNKG